jgi:hypothetical protein
VSRSARSERTRRWVLAIPLLATPPTAALAHGFGERFDLPLPLPLWVTGAAATILVTFVLTSLFVRAAPARQQYPRIDLLEGWLGRLIGHSDLLAAVRVVAAIVFATTILAGLFGTSDPFRNLAPTMIWIVWWVGFAFASALLGNVWAVINPLSSLFEWAEGGYARWTGRPLALARPYPGWFGAWPAVAAFVAFAWTELLWEDRDVPRHLSQLMIAYCAWTWLGMYAFGRGAWLRDGEAFSVLFGILAQFAPFEIRIADRSDTVPASGREQLADTPGGARADAARSRWDLRPPAVGLIHGPPVDTSRMVFVLAMLSTVSFDGLLETPLWQSALQRAATTPLLSPALALLGALGLDDPELAINTAALVAMPFVFLSIYLVCARAVAALGGGRRASQGNDSPRGAMTLARTFVCTLVPIAIAYDLAHYLSLLVSTGQFIIPLASDPLGFGWDLWGTAGYKVNLLVSASFVWYFAVTTVVLGHVASVYLAHVVAMKTFGDRRTAFASQIPMILLMMTYTMTSLWILAQPIV